MEIIMISDCKLKIMLGEEDLQQFDIKAEELDYSNTETKRMFWDILNRAKHQTGFDTDGQRVLVQLYPSKQGGCEMFVTKIGLLSSENENNNKKCYYEEKIIHKPTKNKNENKYKKVYSVFGFDSVKPMIEVCKRLCSIGYNGDSYSYICDNGKKYLFLSDICSENQATLNEFSFVSEYGSVESYEKIECFISEHGRTIIGNNAVIELGKL